MASKSDLSSEEKQKLQKELPTVLENQGVNNKSKAKYVKSISEFVIGSQNPKFFSMQPRVKDKSKIEEWKAAYLIILNFLDEYKLDLTKDVLLKELEQNKVPKPPLPSVPPGYSSNNVNEIFNFNVLFDVSNISDFHDRVEYFVTNTLHEEYHEPATKPASQSPAKPLNQSPAKPLNQSPVNSPGAFLTQPSAQQAQNNEQNKSIEDNQDDDFIEDFNDDFDKEEDNQAKTEEKGSKKAEEDQDEIIDIEDINTDDENVDDKKESNEGDDANIEIDDFNDDDEEFINDDSIEGNNENKPEQKSESDAQNNSFSISMNSDLLDGFD